MFRTEILYRFVTFTLMKGGIYGQIKRRVRQNKINKKTGQNEKLPDMS